MGIPRKRSGKREAILRTLRETGTHPGAAWVYGQLKPEIPDLSLGTVYRNLKMFREEGLAQSLGVLCGEERFDAVTGAHPHLVCRSCGAVIDLPADSAVELGKRCEEVFDGETRFSIDFGRTVFYGLCGNCGVCR